ncbi:hypothetical protein HanHA300_Chr05g0186921 [Helianthus annuus]|nr:hypothetical protein HanHA300_Chr05g0186921 [Helianthus annuus]KAJ0747845.1 hypothetical protein HanOQP8_Chr05g0194181 [Helianthus annuus]
MVRSVAWGYVRIMAGTIVGGGLGFYVMHRLEISYKVPSISLLNLVSTFINSPFSPLT